MAHVAMCSCYLAVLDERIGSWLAGESTESSCACVCSAPRVRFEAIVVGGVRTPKQRKQRLSWAALL